MTIGQGFDHYCHVGVEQIHFFSKCKIWRLISLVRFVPMQLFSVLLYIYKFRIRPITYNIPGYCMLLDNHSMSLSVCITRKKEIEIVIK